MKWMEKVGELGLFSGQVFKKFFTQKLDVKKVVEQIERIGYLSMPLVVITALSTGMVMALQFGLGLEKFGAKLYVPKLVASCVLREMGPVFTSLMLAARVSAGIASEIGSMVVTQQIDAMRALSASPYQKIIIPRVLGCLICIPLLVAITNFIANLGGMWVGVSDLNLDHIYYFQKVISTVVVKDFMVGIIKSVFFALFIGIPACYFGMGVQNGTQEVGRATTNAVVCSSIMILTGDFFLTKLFWMVEKWL